MADRVGACVSWEQVDEKTFPHGITVDRSSGRGSERIWRGKTPVLPTFLEFVAKTGLLLWRVRAVSGAISQLLRVQKIDTSSALRAS